MIKTISKWGLILFISLVFMFFGIHFIFNIMNFFDKNGESLLIEVILLIMVMIFVYLYKEIIQYINQKFEDL